jgi:crotonobetainyl-CoA:carnitine CoA-transferase CaiB-like acyl-CoA transferase
MPSHGKTGPEAHHVAYGTNVEQLSGLASITGYEGDGPHKSPIAYGDPNAGAIAAAAALAALLERERTGEGQHIEVAQWEAMAGNIGEFALAYQMAEREDAAVAASFDARARIGNRHQSRVQGVYPCAGEDQWVAISIGTDAEFASACGVIGRAELIDDARFADVVSRRRNHDQVDVILSEWTVARSQVEAAELMQASGVPASPVLRVPDLMQDPHLRARGFWETVTHASAGTWDMEGPVWRMSRTPAHIRTPAPRFGEHNEWVLSGLLGLQPEDIGSLAKDGVIASAPDESVHS